MLGLSTAITRAVGAGRQYIKDGLKLYMPYKGADTTKGTQFVGTGSTSFDGSNDYVVSGSNIGVSGDTARTVCAWCKVDTLSDQAVITNWGAGSTANANYFKVINSTYVVRFDMYGTQVNTSTAVTVGEWTHLAYTFDGVSTVKIYINGSEEASASTFGAMDTTNSVFRIG